MALQSSGQIPLSDIRTEMSQSAMNNYSLHEAYVGSGYWGNSSTVYSPVNVNGFAGSSGRWDESNRIGPNDFSMSLWYTYDHLSSIALGTTGSLYIHAIPANGGLQCDIKTMLLIDAGTSDSQITINISGSASNFIEVYYGKPWKNDGTQNTASADICQFITRSLVDLSYNINNSFTYNYVYNSAYGQYIYFVIFANYCT